MSYNKIAIIGYLGRDPELRYTTAGKAVCSFSVATTEKWGQGDNQQEKTTWFKIIAWGKMGENASKYLVKGRPVYVEGRLSTSEWTDREGQKRVDLEVNATEIQYLSEGSGKAKEDKFFDQRRPGTDDHDQRPNQPAQASSDALPLDDKVPF